MLVFYVVFLTLTLIVSSNRDKNTGSRIIMGKKSLPGQFPFMTSIQLRDNHHCGGTIIDKHWSLTAAHCFYDDTNELIPTSLFSVLVGSVYINVGIKYRINKVYVESTFVPEDLSNDIALIEVHPPYEFNAFVKPIPLLPLNIEDDQEGLPVMIIGWGFTSDFAAYMIIPPPQQYYAEVHTIPRDICMQTFTDVNPHMICVYEKTGRSSCSGDSGGPLIHKGVQVGLLSYGDEQCMSGKPEVYTRISIYYNWIMDTITKAT